MRNWKRFLGVTVVVLWLLQAGGARAQIPNDPAVVSDTYKSPNGRYAVKVEESVKTQGSGSGPQITIRMLETNVTGLAVAEDGSTTQQWTWSTSRAQPGVEMAMAGAAAADSGKLFVVARIANRNPINVSGTDYMPPPVILLDDKGKSLSGVTAGDWWRALERDGEMTRAKPPALRLVDNEKVLEIKLASGKIARVKTDSGELTVVAPPGAAGTATTLTKESARMAVQLLALKSPNPYVREMAYHEHDGDWAMDLKAGTFSVKIHGLQDKVFTGKLKPGEKDATASFDDEAGLWRDWIVPAEKALTAEEVNRCLAAMGERLTDADPSNVTDPNFIKALCAAMKGVEFKVDAATNRMTGAGVTTLPPRTVEWQVQLRERTFEIHSIRTGAESAQEINFTGRFGWDKDRQWTAWPVEIASGGRSSINGGALIGRLRVQPAIPGLNLALGKPASASSSLEGHPAAAANDGSLGTFWQPAANDAQPSWTVDLQGEVALSSVHLVYPMDPSDSYTHLHPTVEVSDDQKTWRVLPDPSAGGYTNPVVIVTNATARFVRLSYPASTPAMGRGRPGGGPVSRALQIPEVVIDGTLPDGAAAIAPQGATRPTAGATAGAVPVITAAVLEAAPPAAGTRAVQANPGVDVTPELALDEQTLAQATARGEALLKQARWTVPAIGTVNDAGNAVIASNGGIATAVEKATGKQVWQGATPSRGRSGTSATSTATSRGPGFESLPGPIRAIAPGTKGLDMVLTNSNAMLMVTLGVDGLAKRWEQRLADIPTSVSLSFTIAQQQVLTSQSLMHLGNGPPLWLAGSGGKVVEVRAYDRETGKEQWRYPLPVPAVSTGRLTVADGVVYLAPSHDQLTRSTLIALHATDGKVLFTAPRNEVLSPVAVKDGQIVASSSSGEVIGFDAKTGQEQWRERVWLSREPGRVTLADQRPMTDGGNLQDEPPVFAGNTLLVPVLGRTNPPAITSNSADIDNGLAGLAAFDAKTHKQVWFFRPPEDTGKAQRNSLTMTVSGSKRARQLYVHNVQAGKDEAVALAVGSRSAYLGVDLKTGKLDWLVPALPETTSVSQRSMPLVSNEVMYIVNDRTLMAVPLDGK